LSTPVFGTIFLVYHLGIKVDVISEIRGAHHYCTGACAQLSWQSVAFLLVPPSYNITTSPMVLGDLKSLF
jgi:hypothetical protein